MLSVSKIICPNLKGSSEGAVCMASKTLVKDLQDVTIKICMGRHYEVCYIYMVALSQEACPNPFNTVLET
ncbi:MAG: hypothetical protein HGA78_01585 [Nitrospirales bacterium]|nr:hypothetical protein [Nitrospirales bacterium]